MVLNLCPSFCHYIIVMHHHRSKSNWRLMTTFLTYINRRQKPTVCQPSCYLTMLLLVYSYPVSTRPQDQHFSLPVTLHLTDISHTPSLSEIHIHHIWQKPIDRLLIPQLFYPHYSPRPVQNSTPSDS